ncbi:hypothetical protein HMPREF9694_05542 [Klebsiella michiganensis]|nr:hypothetical protein HMPREF9694_05542 [Klebsiella michiganensis]
MKIFILIMMVFLFLLIITTHSHLTHSFPGDNSFKAIDFSDPSVIVTHFLN